VVERTTRTIEIAMTIAATPDQVMPLARLLTVATTAAEIESMNAHMERLSERQGGAPNSAPRTVRPGADQPGPTLQRLHDLGRPPVAHWLEGGAGPALRELKTAPEREFPAG
jgi:hypothetical protein